MPIYEYRCDSCDHRFEELVRDGNKPPCPKCGRRGVERLISVFSAQAGGQPQPALGGGCGRCGDPNGPCGLDA